MKRVLFVGADFAPSSMPPALRMRFFVRHLPEFGWEPIILTTDPQYYEWPVDPENERLLPDGLEVIRTAAISACWTRKFGFGDIGIRSLWHHWDAISRVCYARRPDLLFIPVPPNVGMALGRLAYERFGVPYIIDYIDPVVTEYYWKLPRSERPPKWAMAYYMNRLVESFALKRVSHITAVSNGTIAGVLARYPRLRAAGATEIPYGVEPSDFEYLRLHPRPNPVFNPQDGLIHVSYIGAYTPAMQKVLEAIFSGVRKARDKVPELLAHVRLHFVGTSYAPAPGARGRVVPLAEAAGVGDVVDEQPTRVSYLDALQIMLDSYLLVAIGSAEPHYSASKIFSYILARKPLLAVFHQQSNVVAILNDTRAGIPVTFGRAEDLSGVKEEIARRFVELLCLPGDYKPAICWEKFEHHTARAMTARLAGTFSKVVRIGTNHVPGVPANAAGQ